MNHRPDWCEIRVVLDDREQVVGSPDALRDLLTQHCQLVVETNPGRRAAHEARLRLGRVLMQVRAALPPRGWIRYVESAVAMNRNTIKSCQRLAARWYAAGGRDVMDASVVDRLRARAVGDLGVPSDHPAITGPIDRIKSKHLEVLLGIRSWKSTPDSNRTPNGSGVQTPNVLGGSFGVDPTEGEWSDSLADNPDGDLDDDVDAVEAGEPLAYRSDGVPICTCEDIDAAEDEGYIDESQGAALRLELVHREPHRAAEFGSGNQREDLEEDLGHGTSGGVSDAARAVAVVGDRDPDRSGVLARDRRDGGDQRGDAGVPGPGQAERLVPADAHRVAIIAGAAAASPADPHDRSRAAVRGDVAGRIGGASPVMQLSLADVYAEAASMRAACDRAVNLMRLGATEAAIGVLAELRGMVDRLAAGVGGAA